MKNCLHGIHLGNFNAIPTGTKVVEKGVPIFPRLDADVEVVYIRDQMAITAPAENAPAEQPQKWKLKSQ